MDGDTTQVIKEELSIFDDHTFQVAQQKAQWNRVYPRNQYTGYGGGNIEFDIPEAEGWYLDFNDSYLLMNVSIIKLDAAGVKTKLTASDDVAFVNYVGAALFKDVKLLGGGQKIEGETQNYSYKAYIYTLLAGKTSAKQYQLQALGWQRDDANAFDMPAAKDAAKNAGYAHRKKWTAESASYQLAVPLILDCWMQRKLLLDKMPFSLILQLNEPKFALQTDVANPTYKIDIERCELWFRQVNVSKEVIDGHAIGLEKHNAIYAYNGYKIFNFFIGAGGMTWFQPNAFKGTYPKLVTMALVDHKACVGDWKLSPWNFSDFKLKSIGLKLNGHWIPHPPFTPNWENGHVVREYMQLFLSTGRSGMMDDDNGILIKDFGAGNAIYCFNLAPDLVLSGHGQPAKLAPIDIEISFSQAIDKPLDLICCCVYDTKFEVTKDRLVIINAGA